MLHNTYDTYALCINNVNMFYILHMIHMLYVLITCVCIYIYALMSIFLVYFWLTLSVFTVVECQCQSSAPESMLVLRHINYSPKKQVSDCSSSESEE